MTHSPSGRIAWGLAAIAIVGIVAVAWYVQPVRAAAAALLHPLPVLLYAAVPLVAAVAHRRPSRPRSLTGAGLLCASVVAYLVPVFGSWARAGLRQTLAGVIPLTDGAINFGGAQRLLFGGDVDDASGRRPLNALFLAVRLAVTGLDLRMALVLQAVLLGAAGYLAARVVARDLGAAAGVAFFAAVYAFAYPTGNTWTEALGVTFGVLAFATAWTAARDRSPWLAGAAVFLAAIAQSVRASAVILPVFLAVGLALVVGRGRRGSQVRVLGLGIAAILLAFAVNVAGALIGGSHVSSLGGNGGAVVYAMAKGEPMWDFHRRTPNWSRAYTEFRLQLEPRTEQERSAFINDKARAAVLDDPMTFVRTYLASAGNYARFAWEGVAGPFTSPASQQVLAFFVGAGLASVVALRWRRWRELLVDLFLLVAAFAATPVLIQTWGEPAVFTGVGLTLAAVTTYGLGRLGSRSLGQTDQVTVAAVALAAIVLQVPMLGAETTRVLAALVPYLALPFVFAVAAIDRSAAPERESVVARWSAPALGGAVVAVTLLGAPVAMVAVDAPHAEARTCPGGEPAEALIGGVAVQLGREGRIDEADLRLQPNLFGSQVDVGTDVVSVVSAVTPDGNDRILLLTEPVDAPIDEAAYVCGDPVRSGFLDALMYGWPKPVDFRVIHGTVLDDG